MKGRTGDVPDPERRGAANAALKDSIEEVCRHYAPSGARVEDCWEVRDAGDRVALRVFLAGPMQGSWTEAATGERGDTLDLVVLLRGLDAAGALAEAERFLDGDEAGPKRKSGDAGGGQMALFETLPETGGRKRPARRSAGGRKAGALRRTPTARQEPQAGDTIPRPGDEPAGADQTAAGSQVSPEAPAPEGRKEAQTPAGPSRGAGPSSAGSGPPAPNPDSVAFSAEDRQRIRKTAEDAAWIRSRLTVRSLDARAQERAKARKDGYGRRWRRASREAVSVLALAAVWLVLGVAVENRYGVSELVAAYGAELVKNARILPGGDSG